jgi:lysine-specific demethylase 3
MLSAQDRAELNAKRDRHAQRNPFFLSCNRRNEHGVLTFSPVTRFAPGELEAAVVAMEKILPKEDSASSANGSSASTNQAEGGGSAVASADAASSLAVPEHGPEISEPTFTATTPAPWLSEGAKSIVSDPRPPSYVPSPNDPPPTPTWPVAYFDDDALTEDRFARLWVMGAPLVVTDLLKKFHLQWTPEYFIKAYGQQNCIILHCQQDANKRVTVGEFFSWFGKFDGRTDCWKLKV